MFKQFTENITENQVYLLSALGIFLAFFIVVTILLMGLKKQHIIYMSDLPLIDSAMDSTQTLPS